MKPHNLPHFLKNTVTLLVIFTFIILTSCSPNNSLTGSWSAIEGKSNFSAKKIAFEENGAFYFDSIKGSWSIDEKGAIVIKFPNVLPNTYTYEITNDSLILKDQVGIAGEFKRLK